MLIAITALISVPPLTVSASDGDSQDPLPTAGLTKATLIAKYAGQIPQTWGERVPGVITRIDTSEKVVALTLDACGGGGRSNGYDKELIDFLIREGIPATLFISARWIDANYETFMELAHNPLFTIANHGYLHKPLSVTGRSVYGVGGTADVGEVIDEVLLNERKIESLTGRKPRYFRSGTAYYDEVAVKIVNDLGEKVIGFDVLGDAGATFSKDQVKKALLGVRPGSIIIAHMNHPEAETAEGIMAAVPELRSKGFRFVKLEEYDSLLTAGE
ncbi:MAG: polysaccharide deacetylase family protein [Limnochordales bacterium]|nr:polysaccharide deacetylase family protein [Limnochordales bacterium]